MAREGGKDEARVIAGYRTSRSCRRYSSSLEGMELGMERKALLRSSALGA